MPFADPWQNTRTFCPALSERTFYAAFGSLDKWPMSGHLNGAYCDVPVLPRPLSMLSKQSAAVLAVVVVSTPSAFDMVTGRRSEVPEA